MYNYLYFIFCAFYNTFYSIVCNLGNIQVAGIPGYVLQFCCSIGISYCYCLRKCYFYANNRCYIFNCCISDHFISHYSYLDRESIIITLDRTIYCVCTCLIDIKICYIPCDICLNLFTCLCLNSYCCRKQAGYCLTIFDRCSLYDCYIIQCTYRINRNCCLYFKRSGHERCLAIYDCCDLVRICLTGFYCLVCIYICLICCIFCVFLFIIILGCKPFIIIHIFDGQTIEIQCCHSILADCIYNIQYSICYFYSNCLTSTSSVAVTTSYI